MTIKSSGIPGDISIEFEITPRYDIFLPRVESALAQTRARTVYDLGGGANPVLPERSIAAHDIRYIVVDPSEEELALAPPAYTKLHGDPSSPRFHPSEPGDVVLTRFVLEHVRDPETFHRNVFELLSPGGRAIHFFSTLYSPPFLINRVLPDVLTRSIVGSLQPERELGGRHRKFPALYRWCRGPTRRQLRRFTDLGYEINGYFGFFGHHYLSRFERLQRVEDRWAGLLERRPIASLTSYAMVDLQKPPQR